CDPQLRLAVLAGAKLLECPQSPVARMPERFICTLAVLSASRWRVCRHVKVAWSYRPGGGDELRLVIGVESSAQRPHRSASCSHSVPASLTPLPDLLAHPVIRQAPYYLYRQVNLRSGSQLLLASAGGFLARSIACESPELTALEVIDIGGLVGLRRCWWHGLGRLLRSGWRRLGRTSRRSRERTSRYGLGSGWEGLWSWQVLRCSCEG